MSQVAISASGYGAVELKQVAKKYATWALVIATLVHLFLLGSYWASVYLAKEEAPPMRTVRLKYTELGPPPSIQGNAAAVAPSVSVASPTAKPSVGIPVPVPDADVSPEQTFASQTEMSSVAPVGEGTGGEGGAVIEQDINVENITEEEAPPPDFVPFEKEPVIVKKRSNPAIRNWPAKPAWKAPCG